MAGEHVIHTWWRVNRAASVALTGVLIAVGCLVVILIGLLTDVVPRPNPCGGHGGVASIWHEWPAIVVGVGIVAGAVASIVGIFGSVLRTGRRVAQWSSVTGALLTLGLVLVLLYLPIFQIINLIC